MYYVVVSILTFLASLGAFSLTVLVIFPSHRITPNSGKHLKYENVISGHQKWVMINILKVIHERKQRKHVFYISLGKCWTL